MATLRATGPYTLKVRRSGVWALLTSPEPPPDTTEVSVTGASFPLTLTGMVEGATYSVVSTTTFSDASTLDGELVTYTHTGAPDVSPQVTLPAEWQLRFWDDFDGSVLDEAKWFAGYRYGEGTGAGGTDVPTINQNNGEDNAYTKDAVTVDGGLLNLTGAYLDGATIDGRGDDGGMYPATYKSGMVSGRHDFQYGYMEVRFKLPGGQGSWPAIWLLDTAAQWPPELDLMESVNNETDRIHATRHASGIANVTRSFVAPGNDLSYFRDSFRTVAVKWTATELQFYVEGQPNGAAITTGIPAEPMYPILNLAVGGTWPGEPTAADFPRTFQVDYCRIWGV